jgi:hypothetical protein
MTGGNVTNDFLDNLAAEQYRKMHKKKKQELQGAYDQYVKIQRDLTRLEGSMQAIQYCAYGKMPGDGNHDQFKDHKPHD